MIITRQHKNFQFGNLNLRKITLKFCLMAAGFGCFSPARSQTNNILAEADSYFTAGEYYTAAVLYGQYLHPAVKSKSYGDFPLYKRKGGRAAKAYHSLNDVAYKQAESYRLSHYWQEAADLYKSCYLKDSVKYEGSLYWYAVCQRSLGNFELANKSLQQFLSQSAQDNALRKDAEREIATLRFIQNQLQRPDTALFHLQKLSGTNLPEKGLYAPIAGLENQVFFTSTQTDSLNRPGVSPYHNRLFSASVRNGSLENIAPVSFDGLDGSLNQGTASVSVEGNYIYFTQWENESGKSTSSIYYSKKNGSGWSQPLPLNSVNLTGSNTKQPFCSPDGKYLYFSTDREGGQGGFDIWYAPLKADGTTGSPVNAGSGINTDGNEQAPFIHGVTNTLVFASDKLPGMGGYDLFMAKGNEGNWRSPVNMGYPVNSTRDDIYFFTAGRASLLENAWFSSDRGNSCCLSTFSVTQTPKNKILTGVVMDCETSQPLAGAEIVLRGAGGKELRMLTDNEGKYHFDFTDAVNAGQFLVSKEKYEDTSTSLQPEKIIESNWRTDTVYNAPICVAEKKLVIKVENVVSVYFSFDRSRLKDRARVQLDSIYTVLTENPGATIQISGYTDGLGSVDYNKKLSDKRAKACADYLTARGIEPARITFESFGACCPVEMEKINGRDNPGGRMMNRRALINISK